MNKICVWADETWCWEEEVYSYNYMSDDYFLVEVPDEVDDIDEFVLIIVQDFYD